MELELTQAVPFQYWLLVQAVEVDLQVLVAVSLYWPEGQDSGVAVLEMQ